MDEQIGPASTGTQTPQPPAGSWSPPTMVPLTPGGQGDRATPPPPPAPSGDHRSGRTWPRRLAVALAVVLAMVGAGAVGAVIGQRLDDDGLAPPSRRASDVALDVGAARDGDLPPIDVAAVAEFVAPSVVTISADVESPFGGGSSIGTGVIATSDGEIITNAHVVEGATAIRVRLAGESEPREAVLLAADVGNDLALLRVAGDDFQAATFADPDSVRLGDEVVAIGFALDLDGAPSVTLGIVSALERTITVANNVALDGLIQTDAAISSGNSGGPLVNAAGEVVGINTAVARGDSTTAATNVGFAISAKEALPIVEDLRDQADGEVRREAFLGVNIQPREDGGQGAIVFEVDPGTPADEVGIVADDIVIAVDDVPIDGPAGLVAVIRDHEPGDEVDVVVRRDGEQITFTVVLAERITES
jgi:putative serine protease PepD